MKKITIKNVAKAAGVSYTTVSNVINKKGRMSPATKAKVSKIIKKLNFYPDATAVQLNRGKADSIGFISSYLSSPFVFGVLSGAEHRMHETGKLKHDIVHYATKGTDVLKTTVMEDILYGKKASAVILLTMKIKGSLADEFKKRNIPLVLVESKMKGVNSVRADNFKGAYDAVSSLIESGRKNIYVITGPLRPSVLDMDVSPAEFERIEGYKKALNEKGMKFREENIISVPFYNSEAGEKCMGEIIKSGNRPDAVFCAAGDMVACGMVEKAKRTGIKIPSDTAFIGYDDLDLAAAMGPPLTTVRQPLFKMGEVAFDMAVERIEKPLIKAKQTILKPELIIRKTA